MGIKVRKGVTRQGHPRAPWSHPRGREAHEPLRKLFLFCTLFLHPLSFVACSACRGLLQALLLGRHGEATEGTRFVKCRGELQYAALQQLPPPCFGDLERAQFFELAEGVSVNRVAAAQLSKSAMSLSKESTRELRVDD